MDGKNMDDKNMDVYSATVNNIFLRIFYCKKMNTQNNLFNIILLIFFMIYQQVPILYISLFNSVKELLDNDIVEPVIKNKKSQCKNSCKNPCKNSCKNLCKNQHEKPMNKKIKWIIADPNITINNKSATKSDSIIFLTFDFVINNIFNDYVITLPVLASTSSSNMVLVELVGTNPIQFWYANVSILNNQMKISNIPVMPNSLYRIYGEVFYTC